MSLISIQNVSKSFEKIGAVVKPLNLEIPLGQFVSLLGPSGCGKSTLLRLIAGLERPDTGKISGLSERRISFVFQESLLLPWRSALENVRLPLELEKTRTGSLSDLNEIARTALIKVGLKDSMGQRPNQLSGGMKMRVSLARALVTNPEVLLLDEPFSALDEITRFRLQEDLIELWMNARSSRTAVAPMTVIFVTHSMSEAAFLAERQIVFSNRPARVIADRRSSVKTVRDHQVRHSADFLDEVRDLQKLFRETGDVFSGATS